jgi:hypothetical protein
MTGEKNRPLLPHQSDSVIMIGELSTLLLSGQTQISIAKKLNRSQGWVSRKSKLLVNDKVLTKYNSGGKNFYQPGPNFTKLNTIITPSGDLGVITPKIKGPLRDIRPHRQSIIFQNVKYHVDGPDAKKSLRDKDWIVTAHIGYWEATKHTKSFVDSTDGGGRVTYYHGKKKRTLRVWPNPSKTYLSTKEGVSDGVDDYEDRGVKGAVWASYQGFSIHTLPEKEEGPLELVVSRLSPPLLDYAKKYGPVTISRQGQDPIILDLSSDGKDAYLKNPDGSPAGELEVQLLSGVLDEVLSVFEAGVEVPRMRQELKLQAKNTEAITKILDRLTKGLLPEEEEKAEEVPESDDKPDFSSYA